MLLRELFGAAFFYFSFIFRTPYSQSTFIHASEQPTPTYANYCVYMHYRFALELDHQTAISNRLSW